MPTPQKRPATTGATRRGHYRQVSGVPVDAITASGAGGGGGVDTGITELTGAVTAGPGSGTQAATIAANAVTTVKILDANVTSAKLRDSAAVSVIGRAANSVGVPADIAAASNGQVLQRLANVLAFAGLDISVITDGSLTLAKLADLANQRLIGRNTAGTGVPEAVTLSQLLDWISGSVTQGDILVRGAASWSRLAAPVTGLFLGGNGAGIEPSYQAPFGFASPLATAFHLEYSPSPVNTFKSNRGDSISPSGTIATLLAAGSLRSGGPYFQMGTSASSSSTAAVNSFTSGTNRELSFLWDFDLSFVMYTDASAVSSVRYMLGMGVNNENTDPVTDNWIGFRFSTASADGGWVGVVYDGTQAVTATVAAIAANTRYVLRIRKVGSSVFFSVNGSAEVTAAAHVPVNNAYASATVRVTALAASARSLFLGRFWCDYGA